MRLMALGAQAAHGWPANGPDRDQQARPVISTVFSDVSFKDRTSNQKPLLGPLPILDFPQG